MGTFVFEGESRLYLGAQARLIEDDREVASEWAVQHIAHNPAYAWIIGRFVEADRPNSNKQYFALDQLQLARPTIQHAPMNVNHSARNVVGSFVATELMYPSGEEVSADDFGLNPYIESLGVIWKYYFPDEYRAIQMAAESNRLFYSMECVPEAISSVGGSDDSTLYPYEGRTSPTYPDEINERSCAGIAMHKPHFVGGALIIPPEKPGWRNAEAQQVAALMKDRWNDAERLYASIEKTVPDSDAQTWEATMNAMLTMAAKHAEHELSRNFSQDTRDKMAKEGTAMKDGSFPIANTSDLKNAIQAVGRAKNKSAAISHIKKRAKALGATNLLPDGWN